MAGVESGGDRKFDTRACPVVGDTVTVSATFKRAGFGRKVLVDFGCNLEERCGVPAWDPCPLYVAYLEQSLEVNH